MRGSVLQDCSDFAAFLGKDPSGRVEEGLARCGSAKDKIRRTRGFTCARFTALDAICMEAHWPGRKDSISSKEGCRIFTAFQMKQQPGSDDVISSDDLFLSHSQRSVVRRTSIGFHYHHVKPYSKQHQHRAFPAQWSDQSDSHPSSSPVGSVLIRIASPRSSLHRSFLLNPPLPRPLHHTRDIRR